MDEKRNIVPLMMESFDFGNPLTVKALIGKLENLKKYDALRVPSEYFFEAMSRLRERYLNVALDAVVHPISDTAKQIAEEHQSAANKAEQVDEKELTAQEWLEKGFFANDPLESIRYNTEAINRKPDYAHAFHNRGCAYSSIGNNLSALSDFQKANELEPDNGGYRSSLIRVLKSLGRKQEAEEQERIARELIQKEADYGQACFEAICGNTDRALELLKIGLSKDQATKGWARRDPDLESIREDPRFKELVGE